MLNIRKYLIPLGKFKGRAAEPPIDDVVAQCAHRGFGVEFCAGYAGTRLFTPSNLPLLREITKDLPHTYHCDTGAKGTVEDFVPVIDTAAELHTHCLVVHPQGLKVQRFDKDGKGACKTDYGFASEVVARGTEKGVQFVLENNIQPGAFGDLESALSKVKGLKICLDIGHAFCTAMRHPGSDAGIPRFVLALKNHIHHIHLDWARLSFGRVNLPVDHVQLVIGVLRDAGYDGYATLEEALPGVVDIMSEDRAFFQELVTWVGERPLEELDSDFFHYEYKRMRQQ